MVALFVITFFLGINILVDSDKNSENIKLKIIFFFVFDGVKTCYNINNFLIQASPRMCSPKRLFKRQSEVDIADQKAQVKYTANNLLNQVDIF